MTDIIVQIAININVNILLYLLVFSTSITNIRIYIKNVVTNVVSKNPKNRYLSSYLILNRSFDSTFVFLSIKINLFIFQTNESSFQNRDLEGFSIFYRNIDLLLNNRHYFHSFIFVNILVFNSILYKFSKSKNTMN